MPSAFVGPPAPPDYTLARQAREEEQARHLGAGWRFGPVAASLFDAWATNDAINRGGVEANPIMAPIAGNPALLYGIKGAQGILTGLAAAKLARDGHPGWAKVVGGIGIGVPLAAGGFNLAGGRD